MPERTEQRSRSVEMSIEPDRTGTGDSHGPSADGRTGSVVSTSVFLAAVPLLAVASYLGGGAIPFAGSAAGLFLGAFVLGVVSSSRPIVEVGVAGILVAGVSAVFGNALLALIGVGIPIVIASAVVGGIAGALGAYFGSDLRDGLTREL